MVLKCLKISFLRACVQRFMFENPTIDHPYKHADVARLTKKQAMDYLELYQVGINRYDFMPPLSFVEPQVEPVVEPVVEPTVDTVVEPTVVPSKPTKTSKGKTTSKRVDRVATVRKRKTIEAILTLD